MEIVYRMLGLFRAKYITYQSPYAAGRSESRLYGINYVNTAKCVLVPVEIKNNTHIFIYCYLWDGTTNSGKLFCYGVRGGLVQLMTGLHNGLIFKSFQLCSLPHIVRANTVTCNSIWVTLPETETVSFFQQVNYCTHFLFVCLFP